MYIKRKNKIEKSTNRKNRIVDEAIMLFANKGYNGTTIDDIAEKSGITKAAVYYYFRSKEKIIRAVFERSAKLMDKVEHIGTSNLSPKEKLRIFIKYHIQFGANNKDLSKITFEQTHVLPRRTGEAFNRKKKRVDATLQMILNEGLEDESFSIDDVKITSYAILGLCNWIYRWYSSTGKLTVEQISEICINLLENGYLKCSSR